MIIKIVLTILLAFFFQTSLVYAQFVIRVPQGGTGTSTLTGCLEGNGILPITGTGVPCGSGSGSSFSTTSLEYFNSLFRDWSVQGNGYLAPTTTRGIDVNASSTIGDGVQTGGLTIYGGATTTEFAHFAKTFGVGTTSNTVGTSSFAGGVHFGRLISEFGGTKFSGFDVNGNLYIPSFRRIYLDDFAQSNIYSAGTNNITIRNEAANAFGFLSAGSGSSAVASMGNETFGLRVQNSGSYGGLNCSPSSNGMFCIEHSGGPNRNLWLKRMGIPLALDVTDNFGSFTSYFHVKAQDGGGLYPNGKLGGMYAYGASGFGSSTPVAMLSVHTVPRDTIPFSFLVASSTAVGTTTQFAIRKDSGNVGVGTSSPFAQFSISQSTTSTVFMDVASTTGANSQSVYRIDSDGHRTSSSTAPTLSSGTVDGTDQVGRVTGASSGVVITFNRPFPRVPSCIVTAETMSLVNALSYVPTATTLTVTQVGLGTFNYSCGIGSH